MRPFGHGRPGTERLSRQHTSRAQNAVYSTDDWNSVCGIALSETAHFFRSTKVLKMCIVRENALHFEVLTTCSEMTSPSPDEVHSAGSGLGVHVEMNPPPSDLARLQLHSMPPSPLSRSQRPRAILPFTSTPASRIIFHLQSYDFTVSLLRPFRIRTLDDPRGKLAHAYPTNNPSPSPKPESLLNTTFTSTA